MSMTAAMKGRRGSHWRRIPSSRSWMVVSWTAGARLAGSRPSLVGLMSWAALPMVAILVAGIGRNHPSTEPPVDRAEPIWIVETASSPQASSESASNTVVPPRPARETPPTSFSEVRVEPDPVPNILPAPSIPEVSAEHASPTVQEDLTGPRSRSELDPENGSPSRGSDAPASPPHASPVALESAPARVRAAVPRYPSRALALGIESRVVAMVTTDTSGRVVDVRIERGGGRGFDESVRDALRRTRFSPPRRAGVAVAAVFRIPYDFRLE